MSVESQVSRFNRYVESITSGIWDYDPADIGKNCSLIVSLMLCRLQSMFEWTGLPDSIPQRSLELMLQVGGDCAVVDYEGALYALAGGAGGPPDPYYMPTIYVIANPALKLSKTYHIGKDCIRLGNDSLFAGLVPLLRKHGMEIAEAELSLYLADINSRQAQIISAPDDRTRQAAEKYLADLRKGVQGVVGENAFFDGIRVQAGAGPAATAAIRELVELLQYYKAGMLNDVGLNANFNMKREALNSAESALNDDALFPLVDDMLRMRKKGAEKVNTMFGTDISVELASSWRDNVRQVNDELDE